MAKYWVQIQEIEAVIEITSIQHIIRIGPPKCKMVQLKNSDILEVALGR